MKKGSLVVLSFVLMLSVAAFAQRGGHGGMGGAAPMGGGMGNGAGMGHGGDMGHGGQSGHGDEGGYGKNSGAQRAQQPLKDSQINGGAFRMLERKTGLSSTHLQQLYAGSGAKNFGQFVSAMVVSKNLGLDYNKVLSGLKTASLGQTLQDLGVSKDTAKSEIRKAHREIKDGEKDKDSNS
jgi:hypothetical protein